MLSKEEYDEAIVKHLREVAHAKRAMLQIVLDIAEDYPSQAVVLVRIVKDLTRSANKLLGDTAVD